MRTRLELLRELKADWEEREPCPLCSGSGTNSKGDCRNCDGIGVVPTTSWEESNKEEAKELAELEAANATSAVR